MVRHGKSNTRIYRIWKGIKLRCQTRTATGYRSYGGRGIQVCNDWQDDFMTFYEWAMRSGYKDHLTLERNDVDGHYTPDNCRWIPKREQYANKTNNVRYTYKGETKIQQEWARHFGVHESTIFYWRKNGMLEEKFEEYTEKINQKKRTG